MSTGSDREPVQFMQQGFRGREARATEEKPGGIVLYKLKGAERGGWQIHKQRVTVVKA